MPTPLISLVHLPLCAIVLLVALCCAAPGTGLAQPDLRNTHDLGRTAGLMARSADWRNGPVVYQVLVDRFAPPAKPKEKQRAYRPPQRFRAWTETPVKGPYLEDAEVWSQEIDFWGGDLAGLRGRLDYLTELGVDVIYLNPIFESFTNHKYDAWDYHRIDPALGTRAELKALADDLHARGMKLMLDGVFNHMGRQSPMFQDACRNRRSPWRDFFKFKDGDPRQPIGWLDVANLPELNLENPNVQDYLYGRSDSVVQSYLRQEGIDGWRLDVAFDLGFRYLHALTTAAHTAKPGCAIVGEIYNYPEEWFPAVDGVMNMHGRRLVLHLLEGKIPPADAAAMWETMVADAGIEPILKSWLVLDNHDTPRLATVLPAPWQQRLARILQFTLPGAVCLYYGSELGMVGGEDPEQRAPMRWDLVGPDNPTLRLHRQLLALRRRCAALRYGDFRRLNAPGLFAFLRRTDSVRDSVVVIANPTGRPVSAVVQLRESKFQDVTNLCDAFSDRKFRVHAGLLDLSVPAHDILVLQADTAASAAGYDRYDRIR